MTTISSLISLLLVAGQNQTLQSQLIPVHDSKNGYVDYIKACDALNDLSAELFIGHLSQGGLKTGFQFNVDAKAIAHETSRIRNLDLVQASTEFSKRFSAALSHVAAGNAKPVTYPLHEGAFSGPRPQFKPFFCLEKVFIADSYAEAARGEPVKATQSLLECLRFSRRIRNARTIDYVIGNEIFANALAELSKRISHFSAAEALLVHRFAEQEIAIRDEYLQVVSREKEASVKFLSDVILGQSVDGGAEEGGHEVTEFLKSRSKLDREAILTQASQLTRRFYNDQLAKLGSPEQDWDISTTASISGPNLFEPSLSGCATYLANTAKKPILYTDEIVHRTHLRILVLAARVVEYKWKIGSLPKKLEDCASRSQIEDPLGQGAFIYQVLNADSFEVYSKGRGPTGPVRLGDKRRLRLN